MQHFYDEVVRNDIECASSVSQKTILQAYDQL